jgi:hypothetical protein
VLPDARLQTMEGQAHGQVDPEGSGSVLAAFFAARRFAARHPRRLGLSGGRAGEVRVAGRGTMRPRPRGANARMTDLFVRLIKAYGRIPA